MLLPLGGEIGYCTPAKCYLGSIFSLLARYQSATKEGIAPHQSATNALLRRVQSATCALLSPLLVTCKVLLGPYFLTICPLPKCY